MESRDLTERNPRLGRWRGEQRICQPDARDPGYPVGEVDVDMAILPPAAEGDQGQTVIPIDRVGQGRDPARDTLAGTARRSFQGADVDPGEQSL